MSQQIVCAAVNGLGGNDMPASRRQRPEHISDCLLYTSVSPVQVAVTINKENQTTRTILESGKFSATVRCV